MSIREATFDMHPGESREVPGFAQRLDARCTYEERDEGKGRRSVPYITFSVASPVGVDATYRRRTLFDRLGLL